MEKLLRYRFWFSLAMSVLFLFGCGGANEPAGKPPNREIPETFTFFDVGAGTRFTTSLAKSLEQHLGAGALEKRGTIDLSMNPRGLLKDHFPELYALHRDLNNEFRARVEHDISLLTFRYPWKKNTPFIFVRMVFSNRTGLPLYFRMSLNKEGNAVVETLKNKYGPPKPVSDQHAAGEIIFWEKSGDILLVSPERNRLGEMEYEVMFTFAANLDDLRNFEQAERAKKAKDLEKAGKTAF